MADNIEQQLSDFLDNVSGQETPRSAADQNAAREIVNQWEYIYGTVGPPIWIQFIVPVVLVSVHENSDGTPRTDWLCTVSYNGEDIENVQYTAHTRPKPGETYMMRQTDDRDDNIAMRWIKVPEGEEERWLYWEGVVAEGRDTHKFAYRSSWPPDAGSTDGAFEWGTWEAVKDGYIGNLFDSSTDPEKGIQMVTFDDRGRSHDYLSFGLNYYDDWGKGEHSAGTYDSPPDVIIQNCSNFGRAVVGTKLIKALATHDQVYKGFKCHDTDAILCHWPAIENTDIPAYDELCWQNQDCTLETSHATSQFEIFDIYSMRVSDDDGQSYSEAGQVRPVSGVSTPPPGWQPRRQWVGGEWDTCTECFCFRLGGTLCTQLHRHNIEDYNVFGWTGVRTLVYEPRGSAWAGHAFCFQPGGPGGSGIVSPIMKVWPWIYPQVEQYHFEPIPYDLRLRIGEDELHDVLIPVPYPTIKIQSGFIIPEVPTFQIGYDTVTDTEHPRFVVYASIQVSTGLQPPGKRIFLSKAGGPQGDWEEMEYTTIIVCSKDGVAAIGKHGDSFVWTDDYGAHWHSLPGAGEGEGDPQPRCFIFGAPSGGT